MKQRRVVITGLGTINAVGLSVDEFWNGLKNGKSGLSIASNEDLGDIPSKVGGEVKNDAFKPENYMDLKLSKRMDRFCHFAMAAAKEAVEDSKIASDNIDKNKVGVLIGSGIGGIHTYYDNAVKMINGGYRRVSPFYIPMLITDMASGLVSIEYGFRGVNYAISSACASASHAIGVSFNHIICGDSDVIVTGGTEAAMSPLGYAGFTQAQALSTHFNETPTRASRPFDKDRDGFVMGEGSGVIVLEEYEHAVKRGAKIYAEMLAFGFSADANHMTAPCPDGSGAALAIKNALEKAEIKPEDIQLVNTHGTSTPLGDIAETKAIKLIFGDHAKKLKINSTKSMTGHTLGAAGGIEAIAVTKMIEAGIIHPTINLDNPDPECDLDYVPHKAIEYPVDIAISNSFGFGGHNATIVLKKFKQ